MRLISSNNKRRFTTHQNRNSFGENFSVAYRFRCSFDVFAFAFCNFNYFLGNVRQVLTEIETSDSEFNDQ